MIFMWVGYQLNCTAPNLEDQWTTLHLTPTLCLSGLGHPTRTLNCSQHSSSGHNGASKPSHPDKVVVFRGTTTTTAATSLLIDWLRLWSTDAAVKVVISQLLKKFHNILRSSKFIVFTRACRLSVF